MLSGERKMAEYTQNDIDELIVREYASKANIFGDCFSNVR